MGPPMCPGCSFTSCTELSQELRKRWEESQGLKWHLLPSGTQAYWKLCLSCHRMAWPLDGRTSNRHSWPAEALIRRGRSKTRLVAGDFYVLETPPEILHHSMTPKPRQAIKLDPLVCPPTDPSVTFVIKRLRRNVQFADSCFPPLPLVETQAALPDDDGWRKCSGLLRALGF